MTSSAICYPVLCLPKTLGVCLARDARDLESCQAVVFWRGQFYSDLRLVDSNGAARMVVQATVRRPKSKLGQWFARLFDLQISVDVSLIDIDPISIASITKELEAAIDSDPETFEEFSGHDVPWWREKLKQSASVQDLMQVIAAAG